MNAKRLKQLIDQRVAKARQEREARELVDREYPKVLKKILGERRSNVHYVLDQASKGKAEGEV
jgi:hypothetical protein